MVFFKLFKIQTLVFQLFLNFDLNIENYVIKYGIYVYIAYEVMSYVRKCEMFMNEIVSVFRRGLLAVYMANVVSIQ